MGATLSLDKKLEKRGFFFEEGEMYLKTELTDSCFPKQLTNTWDLYISARLSATELSHSLTWNPLILKNSIFYGNGNRKIFRLHFAKRDGDIWVQYKDEVKKLELDKSISFSIGNRTLHLKLLVLISNK